MKPKISVVVPIYNTEKYLRKCLSSIVNQTMKDIEIICVDDCSPDESYKIVKGFQENDSRVKYIKHDNNLGQGGARNTAIKASTADFIASVDSDDSMQLTMLEELWKASEDGRFDIVCCGYSKVGEDGQIISESEFKEEIVDVDKNKINVFKLLNPAIWNKLWRKSLFIENDIYYPENIYFQDMATTPLLVACATQIKFIKPCLYNYLVREGSVTNSYSSKHIINYLMVFEILYEGLKRRGLIEAYALDLASNINESIGHHSENVMMSSLAKEEKNQYLRHLLMMKWAFLESHDILTITSEDELLRYLSSSLSARDLMTEKPEIFGIISPPLKTPNILQDIGISLFGLIFRRFINDRQMAKLKSKPYAFFKDSRNSFTRVVGFLLRMM